jgi:L-Ala-D/L-Glu epimerase / N-acetyl-D-glutamate racemase
VARAQLRFAAMDLPLARPFRIARGEKTVAENVLVEIECEGIVGRGEAAPNARYDQSQTSSLAALESFELPGDAHPFRLTEILEAFRSHAPQEKATLTALQSALWDWTGHRMQQPVGAMLGVEPKEGVPSSWTISIDDPAMVAQRVREASDWPIYKLKLGGGDADQAAIEALRGATNRPFRIDANEAWSEEEAVEKIAWLATIGCEFVEQPLPAADIDAASRLRERSVLPLVADEAADGTHSLDDLSRAYDAVNVKLMKTGGIREAVQFIHETRHRGLEIMLGCFVESGLGISAAAQLLPLARWADLDGSALLKADPFEGCRVRAGRVECSGKAGLGVWPRPA